MNNLKYVTVVCHNPNDTVNFISKPTKPKVKTGEGGGGSLHMKR